MKNVSSRAETIHFSSVLIFGLITIAIYHLYSFLCHLLTVQKQVTCHWPKDIPTIRLVYPHACNRIYGFMHAHRSFLLLVHGKHTSTIITPAGIQHSVTPHILFSALFS